jgi:hypothetical protein
MKINGLTLLAVTTFVLITVVVFSVVDMAFGWVFLLTVFGQIALLVTVYKILKDDYTTEKTFDDFYEDHPMGKEYRS